MIVLSKELYTYYLLLIRVEKKSLKAESDTRPFTHNMHFEIALTQGESSRAIEQLTLILKKGRFPSKYIVSLT